MQFALLFAIGHQFFADVKIEQRLAAKEIHFDVFAMLGRFDEKIESLFARFQAHQRALTVVCAAVGKTISAAQIAIVGHMQTDGFYNRLCVRCKISQRAIITEQLTGLHQIPQIIYYTDGFLIAILLHHHGHRCFKWVDQQIIQKIPCGLVDDMYRAAVYI